MSLNRREMVGAGAVSLSAFPYHLFAAAKPVGVRLRQGQPGDDPGLRAAFPEATLHETPMEPCHPGCFPRGTLVLTSSGERPIEEIQSGELVISIDRDGNRRELAVTKVFETKNRLWRIVTKAGELITTETQPLCVAMDQIRQAGKLQPGDTVVLQGTGGVSIYGLQFAKAAGYRTIITSSSDEKLARTKKMGADHTINYKTTPEWGKAVREIVPQGADFIMEVGGGGTLEQSLRCVYVEGHIAIIGVLNNVAPPAALVGHLINTGAKLKGVFVGSRDMFERMCRAMEQHRIEPVVDVVLPFDKAREAFEAMRDNTHFGKIVLKM